MSKKRGKMTPAADEAYSLSDMMVKVTGVRYDIRESSPDFPPPDDHAPWYLLGIEFREPKGVAYARIVWENQDGRVFIESMYIGNMTEWIEPIYGEEGVIAASKIGFADFNRARKTLAEKFPAVEKRLRDYESILTDASAKYRVSVSLRPTGEKSFTFFIVAKIDANGITGEKREELLRRNIGALKAAWDEIMRYNDRWLRELGVKRED